MAEHTPHNAVTVFGGATVDRIAASSAKPIMGVSNPGTTRTALGGVGFNVASILARLGLTSRLVARLGNDPDGETIHAGARAAGIDVSAMTRSDDAATATYIATLDDAGGLIIGIAAMAICDGLTPAVVASAAAAAVDSDLWVVDANLPAETIAFLIDEAAAAGRPVAAMTVSPAKAIRLIPVLDRLTYLFANRYEAATLLGCDPTGTTSVASALAAALAGLGIDHVAVTSGADPMAIAGASGSHTFTPPRVAVANVNGAGDSLAAGTIHALAAGKSFAEAIPFGLAAAATTLGSGRMTRAPFAPGSLERRIAEISGATA
jgi:sugar/nucleoside kinase (ribokinase family)